VLDTVILYRCIQHCVLNSKRTVRPQYNALTLRIGDLYVPAWFSLSVKRQRQKKVETYSVVYGHGILRDTLRDRVTIQAIKSPACPCSGTGSISEESTWITCQRGLRGGQRGNGKDFPTKSVCPASVITPMTHTQTTFIYHNRH
jgi:hypothetical protein